MNYSDYFKIRVLEQRHDFIYGDRDRTEYLKEIAKDTLEEDGRFRIPIYTDFSGLLDSNNEVCEVGRLKCLQKYYFELYMVNLMISRLKNVLNEEEYAILEKHLGMLFGEDSIVSYDVLRMELEIGMASLKDFYDYYVKNGELKTSLMDNAKVTFTEFDFFLPELKTLIKRFSDFILIIDKTKTFGNIYTNVINTYIAGRSNDYLNIKVGCKNDRDWANYMTVNGNYIDYIHDYGDFEMKDFKLRRTKKRLK